jgi:hypothetical protein
MTRPLDEPQVSDLDRLVTEAACRRLVVAVAEYVDAGEAGRIADLFTDDGEFAMPARDVRLVGHDALRAGFGVREAMQRTSRHICGNIVVTVDGPDRATGSSYLLAFVHDGPPDGQPLPMDGPADLDDVHDEYVRTGDGWRIARRILTTAFVAKTH